MKNLLVALAFCSCAFNSWGGEYKVEYSGYSLKLPGPPYTLNSDDSNERLKTFTDEVRKMWSDPVLQESIELGIKTNRMGDFFLDFRLSDGKSAKVKNVKIEMLKHEFLFGAQAFNTKSFGGKEGMDTGDRFERDPAVSDAEAQRLNELYEKEFSNIFNFATVPFYWKSSEPENGLYRFSKDSYPIFRRPSPDTVLEFTQKYGITPKGHCLSWHVPRWSKPEWVKLDKRDFEKYMCRYIKKVAERYDGVIDYWDVSNEITDERGNNNTSSKYYNPHEFMPKDYALKAFKEAERSFSHSTKFISNYTTPVWQRVATYREYSSDWLSVSHLIKNGAKLDVIGLQLHFFSDKDRQNLYRGSEWGPQWLLLTLDALGEFNKPIHITELTFPCMDNKDYGEANQAFITENFYKLWFSHKNVEAITYWHFVDGSNGHETKYNSGFLRRDFSRKPSYEVLDRLINKEWRTDLEFGEVDGMVHFRAFYGKYKVSYTCEGKECTTEVMLSKHNPKTWRIFVDANAQ